LFAGWQSFFTGIGVQVLNMSLNSGGWGAENGAMNSGLESDLERVGPI
jgi:hypothetical protein